MKSVNIREVNNQDWELFPIEDIPLTEGQYQSLCRGYQADWEFRYSCFMVDSWHYIVRSGYWLKKFRYKIDDNGLYHIVEHYTTAKERERNLLEESFYHGYYVPPITVITDWLNPEYVEAIKRLRIAELFYGEPEDSYPIFQEMLNDCHAYRIHYIHRGTCVGYPQFIMVGEDSKPRWATEREASELAFKVQ